MKTLSKLLLATSVLVAFSGLASASTLSVNCSTVSGNTELAGTISCAQFNLSGQILQSIGITFTGSVSGSITLTNNASTTQNVVGTTNSSLYATNISGFTFASPVIAMSFSTPLSPLAAGSTTPFTGLSSGNQTSSQFINNSLFGSYIGAGNFGVDIFTLSGVAITGGGGQISSAQSTQGTATATVVYTYTEQSGVPEPATMLLTGGLLLALGVIRKKSRKA